MRGERSSCKSLPVKISSKFGYNGSVSFIKKISNGQNFAIYTHHQRIYQRHPMNREDPHL